LPLAAVELVGVGVGVGVDVVGLLCDAKDNQEVRKAGLEVGRVRLRLAKRRCCVWPMLGKKIQSTFIR
jgi:hypothetical protein